jgi:hypothetical protein
MCHCRSFKVTNPNASETFAEFNAPLTSCLLANIKIAASASDYVGDTFAISKYYYTPHEVQIIFTSLSTI